MKNFFKTVIIILIIGTLLTACSTGSNSNVDESKKGNPEKANIALIVKSVDSEFWLTVKAGAEAAAEELGVNVEFKGAQTETDLNGQVSILENSINQGFDAIILAPSDADALVPPVETAHEKDIPVIIIDSALNSDLPVSYIATDNVAAAELAAETMAKLIGEQGDVAILSYVPGAASAIDRETGFEKGIEKYKNINIVAKQYSQSDKARALSVTEDILTSNPNLAGYFSANNRSALGAAQAILQKGLKDQVVHVAFDADPDEISGLQEGTIDALVVQNPYKMGYLAVENALKVINGEEVEKRIDTGVTIVTMENFNDPQIQELLFPDIE